MYQYFLASVTRLEQSLSRRDWVLIIGTGLAYFFDKKAEIDFNKYENRLLKRESDDKVDIDSHINLLFEKRSEPHIHPTKEVVKTQGSCLSTTISKFSSTRFN